MCVFSNNILNKSRITKEFILISDSIYKSLRKENIWWLITLIQECVKSLIAIRTFLTDIPFFNDKFLALGLS